MHAGPRLLVAALLVPLLTAGCQSIAGRLARPSGTPSAYPSPTFELLPGGAVSTPTPKAAATLEPALELATPVATSVVPEGFVGTSFWSIADAQAAVSFPLLVPDPATLPAGLRFTEAQLIAPPNLGFQPTNNMGLRFSGPDMELSVEQLRRPGQLSPPTGQTDYETVPIRGALAYLVDYSRQTQFQPAKRVVVMWEEGGMVVSVNGSLDREQMLGIAEGLQPYVHP